MLKSRKMFQFSYTKYMKAILVAVVVLVTGVSCKKELREEQFPASLTIVNGINDNTSLLSAYFGESRPKVYSRLVYISSGSSFDYATIRQQQPLTLFRNNDTLTPEKPFLRTSLQMEPGGIFTHFVYGSATDVRQKTVKEQLPHRSLSDSVAYLRIINLFTDRAIDVVQLEPLTVTMVNGLAYEQLSDFIKVPVTTAVNNFRFEVKDHETGVTITTLSEINIYPGSTGLSTQWLFKPRTMLVTGTWTAPGVFSARAKTIGHF